MRTQHVVWGEKTQTIPFWIPLSSDGEPDLVGDVAHLQTVLGPHSVLDLEDCHEFGLLRSVVAAASRGQGAIPPRSRAVCRRARVQHAEVGAAAEDGRCSTGRTAAA